MRYELVVIHPFANFKRGDVIPDPTEVDKVLASHKAAFVVKRVAAQLASK